MSYYTAIEKESYEEYVLTPRMVKARKLNILNHHNQSKKKKKKKKKCTEQGRNLEKNMSIVMILAHKIGIFFSFYSSPFPNVHE